MTIIKRILFGMDEILSVRLGCRKCKASLNVPFGENEYVPEVCPYCKETWFKNGSIVGSYHKISTKHLDAYLDEFEWRFNNRENPFLFRDTLKKLVDSENVEYKKLVAS